MNNLKLIQHTGYLLLINLSLAPKDKEWCYDAIDNGSIYQYEGDDAGSATSLLVGHLPLNGAPLLEGVNLLPELPIRIGTAKDAADLEESDILSHIHNGGNVSWSTAKDILTRLQDSGYLRAASKQHSEEDVLAAIHLARIFKSDWLDEFYGIDHEAAQPEYNPSFKYPEEEIIEHLSPVPVLPVDFEPVWEPVVEYVSDSEGNQIVDTQVSIVTNEQGIPAIQGKWIY